MPIPEEIVSVKFFFFLIMLRNNIGEHVPYPKGVPGVRLIFNPSGSADCVFQVLTAYQCLKTGNAVTPGRQWENACLAFINTGNLQGPVSWEDLEHLEKLNNVCLRIYSLDNISKGKKSELTLVRKGLTRKGSNSLSVVGK